MIQQLILVLLLRRWSLKTQVRFVWVFSHTCTFCHNPHHYCCITTTDGMTLRGWWVPGLDPNSDLAVVFCHGGGRDRRAWLRHTPIFQKAGMPCLLFDLREHGISDGEMRGFHYGIREQYDVLAAVKYAKVALFAPFIFSIFYFLIPSFPTRPEDRLVSFCVEQVLEVLLLFMLPRRIQTVE